jgi:hypothetical protein
MHIKISIDVLGESGTVENSYVFPVFGIPALTRADNVCYALENVQQQFRTLVDYAPTDKGLPITRAPELQPVSPPAE